MKVLDLLIGFLVSLGQRGEVAIDTTDLDKAAADIQKSLAKDDKGNEQNVVAKALDVLGMAMTALGLKKSADTDKKPDDDKPLKKAGETKQPYGDQNSLNVGEMSPRKVKLFEYLAKLSEADIEEIENSIAEYPNGAKVTKGQTADSIDKIMNDPDLSGEDKVIEVTEYLEKSFATSRNVETLLTKSLPSLLTGVQALLQAHQSMEKSIETAGLQPRGRASIDHLPDADTLAINPRELLFKACQIVRATNGEELNANDVSLLETQLNMGQQLDKALVAKIQAWKQ